MPADNGFLAGGSLAHPTLWGTSEPAKYQAIDLAKGHPLRRSTAENIELVAKNEDFGLQRRPRAEQPGCGAPDEPEELAHRADYQPIRGMTSAVEFPVGTST